MYFLDMKNSSEEGCMEGVCYKNKFLRNCHLLEFLHFVTVYLGPS